MAHLPMLVPQSLRRAPTNHKTPANLTGPSACLSRRHDPPAQILTEWSHLHLIYVLRLTVNRMLLSK